MEREEALVKGDVFGRGLRGLENAVNKGQLMKMQLDVGPTVFQMGLLRQDKAFCLHWIGMTNISNVAWQRFVALRLAWPPVKALSCFTWTTDEGM